MKNQTSKLETKRLQRLTGFMYLLVIICAGFSQGYVRGTLIVPADAGAIATNILANEELFRLGLITDLIFYVLIYSKIFIHLTLILNVNRALGTRLFS